MKTFKGEQQIEQLDKRKGGYFFLKIDASIVNKFKNKRQTRLICNLDNKISFQCGLNHLGDGNFFVILSTKNVKFIKKKTGETIKFELSEDPNPLGIEIPEAIEMLLEQDEDLKNKFSKLTDGKKRSIIVRINKMKDIDKQISTTIELIKNPDFQRRKRGL
jgi:hypothetical protein